MYKITQILLTSMIVVSCSKSSIETNDNPASPYIEYIWHSAGDNFNLENLEMLVDKWNKIIDNSPCEMNGANILTPTEKRENYDFIWVLGWPSESARDTCWDDWTQNHAIDWDKEIDGIMSYDPNNAFMFKSSLGRMPKEENTTKSFVNTFYFCKFNDGSDMSTLKDYRNDLAEIDSFSSNHWYILLDPVFDMGADGPDFVWLDLWANNEDKNSDNAILETTNLSARVEAMVSCDEISNNAIIIR